MGAALRGRRRTYLADEVKDIVKVKQVCSGASSEWSAASLEPVHHSSGQHTKSAAVRLNLGGGTLAKVILRDTTGDGRFDQVEQPGDVALGEASDCSACFLLPNMAMDLTGDGHADVMMVDTRGDGRYDTLLHRDRASLSFIAAMASEEPVGSPASASSTSRSFFSPRLHKTVDVAEEKQTLAPGWEQVWSQSQNAYYYCHRATRRVTWDRTEAIPSLPGADEGADVRPLAPGWVASQSRTRNATYYRHPETGRTTWQAAEARLGYPTYWSHGSDSTHFVDLVPSGSTFRAVQMLLASTFLYIRTRDRKTRMPAALEAVKVWRVENSAVWGRYATHRAWLQKKADEVGASLPAYDPPAKTSELLPSELRRTLGAQINEVYLFHGTSPTGAAGIVSGGFDLTKAAGTACYGRGVYLSECSSKSDEYCVPDEDGEHSGHCAMFLCRVALGCVLSWPHAEFSEELKASWSLGHYDSILGDRQKLRGTYREFVLPQESQDGAYPEYIVIYKRVYDD